MRRADDSTLPSAFLIRQRMSSAADSIRCEDGEALIKRILIDITGVCPRRPRHPRPSRHGPCNETFRPLLILESRLPACEIGPRLAREARGRLGREVCGRARQTPPDTALVRAKDNPQ